MNRDMKKKSVVISLAASAAVWGAAFGLGKAGEYLFSGLVLILLAAAEYLFYYRRERYLLQAQAVFSLSWTGGAGLSAMKLSKLAGPWENVTWLCFFLVYACFILGYELAGSLRTARRKRRAPEKDGGQEEKSVQAARLLRCIYAVLAVSAACFILEAAVLREIPLFSDKPHAYSYFHLSGVHYFTVTSIFVLPLSVLYKSVRGSLSRREWVTLGLCCAAALMIPVLCVSRFQLMMAVFLSLCVAMTVFRDFKLRYLLLAAAALIPVYVGLTVARNHDVAYLNGIFEMKNRNTPIFITQPYMYIANNYDNFNCLVEELPRHSLGLKGMFPLWAFTGLKFLKPELVNWPLYTTKEELTTVTLFYDAYYDFGVAGVILFAAALGAAAGALSVWYRRGTNPAWPLFYAQAALYFMLSFFTTWYSNPTTWFYFGVTAAFALWCGRNGWPFQKDRGTEKQ